MKKTFSTLAFLIFICTLSSAQSNGVAPKIISTIPEFGDCNVDPELKEIIIRFDQDMSSLYSIVDTKNLPQYTAKPRWIDKKTLSVPVKLFPDKLYSLAFNSSRFQGFSNLSGIPLNPDELHFKTKSISFTALNKQSYKEFIEIFPKMYSYASIKGIDWKEVVSKNQSDLENSKSPAEFALKLVKILKPAEDPHIWIDVEGERFATGRKKIVNANYTAGLLFTILQDRKATSTLTTISGVYDNIGYLSMKDWSADPGTMKLKVWGNSQNPEYPLIDVLKELTAYPNLIIDVRENSGGSEIFAKKIAAFFVSDSIPYEKVINYNDKTGKFDKEHIKKIYPSPNHIEYSGKIYVLSGPYVMSSNESFILMMKQLPNATIVGMKTYGSTGNPQTYTLSNGVTLYLPSWQAYTLDGKFIEGSGIEPDIEIITNKEDFQKKDILFEKVVSLIKEQK